MNRSKLEDDIEELASIIDNSKNSLFSANKITVDREQLEELVDRMRRDLPKELEYCRDLMSRSEAIEQDARYRADKLIQEATEKTYEILDENELNTQAKKRARETVELAAKKGQEVYEQFVAEGDAYRESAQQYLNDMLMNLQEMIYSCIDSTTRNTNKFLESLNQVGTTVTENLNELNSSATDNEGQSDLSGLDENY